MQRWAESERREPGALVPLATAWALAQAWYGDRLHDDFRRRTSQEAGVVFAEHGLTGPFWEVP